MRVNVFPVLVLVAVGLVAWGLVVAFLRRDQAAEPEGARSFVHPSPRDRRSLRYGAAAGCGLVAALYVVFGALVVRPAEADLAYTDDTTWGAYLMLALVYVAGTVLLAVVDLRPLWVVGALLQVVALVAFATFGVGVFDHEALTEVAVVPWVVAITGLQVALLAVLSYLAATPTGRAGSPPTPRAVAAPLG